MHSELEELFIVFTKLPAILQHLCTELIQRIGIVKLRILGSELEALFLREVDDLLIELTWQTTRLPEDHTPSIIIDSFPTSLTDREVIDIHQCYVLHVLAEWRHERRIAETRPYIGDLIKEANEQVIDAKLGLSLLA